MKKLILLIVFLFFTVNCHAQDNKVGLFAGVMSYSVENPVRGLFGLAYERNLVDIKDMSILTEVDIGISPLVNFYALNLDLIVNFNLEEHNFRAIFAPLYYMDFGKLFRPDPWINYSLGAGVAYQWELIENSFLEVKVVLGIPIYEKEKSTNIVILLGSKKQF